MHRHVHIQTRRHVRPHTSTQSATPSIQKTLENKWLPQSKKIYHRKSLRIMLRNL